MHGAMAGKAKRSPGQVQCGSRHIIRNSPLRVLLMQHGLTRAARETERGIFIRIFRMQDNTNTTFGWLLGSGIVALGLSIVSGMYFAPSHDGHGEGGFPVEDVDAGNEAAAGPSLATLLANGDAAAGEKVFAKCIACHTVNQGGADGIGPNLFGTLGKPIGSHVAGFAYSSALSGKGGSWGYEEMDAWLKSPRAFANGTKMSFAGLSSGEDRANVILYMRDNGGGPALPEPEVVEADAEDAVDAEIDAEVAMAEGEV